MLTERRSAFVALLRRPRYPGFVLTVTLSRQRHAPAAVRAQLMTTLVGFSIVASSAGAAIGGVVHSVWPLIAVSSPQHQVLTVGLASFASSGEAGGSWGVVAAGTFLVAGPLLLVFLFFQRRFTASLVFTGLK